MARGISLHVGVQNYSKFPAIEKLKSPWNDAREMFRFAYDLGYRAFPENTPSNGNDPSNVLIEDNATLGAVSRAITAAAEKLEDGDAFLFTFAGHGTQVPDPLHQERDRKNEVSVLADEYLIDDMLNCLFARFKRGVRVFFVADACHSGTSVQVPPGLMFDSGEIASPRGIQFADTQEPGRIMSIDEGVSLKIFLERRQKYANLITTTCANARPLEAFVVEFAACSDGQVTTDGDENSLSRFTQKFRDCWKQGFSGGCRDFAKAIDRQPPVKARSTPQCTPSPDRLIGTTEFERFLLATPFIL